MNGRGQICKRYLLTDALSLMLIIPNTQNKTKDLKLNALN